MVELGGIQLYIAKKISCFGKDIANKPGLIVVIDITLLAKDWWIQDLRILDHKGTLFRYI